MNIHAQTTQTTAEAALLDAYADRISELPGDTTVTVKRDNAVEALKAGLPTRKVEAWHYTDLRRLLSSIPAFDATAYAEKIAPVLTGSSVLPVLNGVADKAPTVEGASIATLGEKLADGSLGDLLGIADRDDTIGAINSAFVADGFVIEIAEGAKITAPIELQNVQDR